MGSVVAIHYSTMQCNTMQCNAMAQPNARKNAMSCSIPCIRCPRALAMPSSYRALTQAQCFHLLSAVRFFYAVLLIKRRQSPTLRKNALSYTHPCTVSWNATIQCNAMQCNAMQWHSPTLEKTLCHAPFLAYGVLGRSPCHPAPSSEHTVPFFTQFCL